MKLIGKVFFGVLFVILLFSFSHASPYNPCTPNNESEVETTKEKGVTFGWEWESKDKIDGIIMYQVYRFPRKNNEQPPVNADNFKYKDPIKRKRDTLKCECKIIFDTLDKYILGVQTLLYRSKDGKPIGEPIKKSTISWSCNKNCMKSPHPPQYVRVSE
jgi:hypothetical protein